MFQKALDLYFPTVVSIFQEGSTKVPQILDQIFSISVVLDSWFLPSPLSLSFENPRYLDNEKDPHGIFLRSGFVCTKLRAHRF